MKFTHKLVLFGLGGALVAPMFIKGPDGKPLMSIDDWIPKDAVALVDKVSDLKDGAPTVESKSGKQKFYKWKDENGVWQMTQYRPKHLAGDAVEERTVYANANIIQSLDSSQISAALKSSHSSNQNKAKFTYNPDKPKNLLGEDGEDDSGFSMSTVSMKKIPEMINQAQGLDAKMQQRMKMIDQQSR